MIAGIVSLHPGEPIEDGHLHLMLEAMKPSFSSGVETYLMAKKTAAVGRVVHGSSLESGQAEGKVIETPCTFVFGEIYNEQISRVGSVEQLLLERYLERGFEHFADGLNGSFAAVVADPRDMSVTLVTDHMDSWPFYTVIYDHKLYFATEVKALASVPHLPCKPDVSSVLSLAVRGFFVRRRTIIKDVEQMDYATVWHIREGTIQKKPYWRYAIEPASDKGYKHYLDEFGALLRQAVRRRTSSGRIAVMLSGGIDSRGILCCLDEPCEIPVVTYTGRTRDTRHKFGEWAIAERVTEGLGLRLSAVYCDERKVLKAIQKSGYASDGAGFVAEDVWEDIKELTGADYVLAGDECMGQAKGLTSEAQVLPSIGIYTLQISPELKKCMLQNQLDSFIRLSEKDVEDLINDCKANTPYDRVAEFFFTQRIIHFTLPKRRVLAKSGLFVRNPWLDLDILNFVRRLPTRHRIRKRLFCKTINHINPSLARLPRARVSESLNYKPYLAKIERERRAVSRMVIEDNPLLGEFFDISNVRKVIRKVCSDDALLEATPRFDPRALLPMDMFLRLRADYKWLRHPMQKLSLINLFSRIATVATALRFLEKRFERSRCFNDF